MIEHIQKIYDITKFPYFRVGTLKTDGVFDKDIANKLLQQGKIRKREGMHGTLIEIVEEKLVNGKLILD